MALRLNVNQGNNQKPAVTAPLSTEGGVNPLRMLRQGDYDGSKDRDANPLSGLAGQMGRGPTTPGMSARSQMDGLLGAGGVIPLRAPENRFERAVENPGMTRLRTRRMGAVQGSPPPVGAVPPGTAAVLEHESRGTVEQRRALGIANRNYVSAPHVSGIITAPRADRKAAIAKSRKQKKEDQIVCGDMIVVTQSFNLQLRDGSAQFVQAGTVVDDPGFIYMLSTQGAQFRGLTDSEARKMNQKQPWEEDIDLDEIDTEVDEESVQ